MLLCILRNVGLALNGGVGWISLMRLSGRWEHAMTDEIQAEPPQRFSHTGPDGFPDISIRRPPRWVRLWVVGTVCFLAGVISHVVLNVYAPIVQGRAQMAGTERKKAPVSSVRREPGDCCSSYPSCMDF